MDEEISPDAVHIEDIVPLVNYKSTEVKKSVDPYVDLGNLLLEDLDLLDTATLRKSKEEALAHLTRDNVQYLLNKIWELPTERVDDVIVAVLPPPTTRLPREKHLPKAKAQTKWDKYAKQKGFTNRKKSRMVFDEATQTYKPRWGYQRGNDETKDWVVEIPSDKDPFKDYIGERLDAKKERVAKNEVQRMRNVARSQGVKVGGASLTSDETKSKEQISHMIAQTKRATASMGKFTEALPNEKPPKNSGKKRKFDPNEGNVKTEKQKQLDILKRLDRKKPKIDIEKAVSVLTQNEEKNNAEKNVVDMTPKKRRPASGNRGIKQKGRGKGQKKGERSTKRSGKLKAANKARFTSKQKNKGRR